ncbi:MAG: GNAT family N-acetyltransferase [Planctomycetota bacterium]
MQRSYADEPGLLARVTALLGTVFGEWLPAQLEAGTRRGLRWDACSTPFLVEEGGELIAHTGVLVVPAVLGGVRAKVAGVHAVAVHPEHRGRGLARRCIEAALRWCDARFDTVALAGAVPLYERFGFRYLPEHRFVGPAPPPAARGRAFTLRECDPGDGELWPRLLEQREPLSDVCAIGPERDVFCFDAARSETVRYCEALDALFDLEASDGTLHLYDVVAPALPSLSDVVAAVGEPVERVACYFPPDKLAPGFVPEPWDLGPADDPDTWMVRGGWIDAPFMWPRNARW